MMRTFGLVACGLMVLGVSACLEGGESSATVGTSEAAIRNAEQLGGRRAIIEFGHADPTNWRFSHRCTGIMIGPHHALTAAHCTDQAGRRGSSGTMVRSVMYFDPDQGKRYVTNGDEMMFVAVLPEWIGLTSPATQPISDEFDSHNDLAIVFYPSGWIDTFPEDWSYIYTGSVEDARIQFFGAGNTSDSGTGSGVLRARAAYFDEIANSRLIEEADEQGNCAGDSGGPFVAYVTLTTTQEAVSGVFAVMSASDRDVLNGCTDDGDDQFATRINAARVNWISTWMRSDVGTECKPFVGPLTKCY